MISSIGAASMHFVDGKKPSVKSITRDFIVGAVMVALIMQILPESSTSLIHFLLSLAPLSLFQSDSIGDLGAASGGIVSDISTTILDEMEVKVGVPKF